MFRKVCKSCPRRIDCLVVSFKRCAFARNYRSMVILTYVSLVTTMVYMWMVTEYFYQGKYIWGLIMSVVLVFNIWNGYTTYKRGKNICEDIPRIYSFIGPTE